MTATTTAPQGYSATQIALHWAVAVLVAGQYIFKGRCQLNSLAPRKWPVLERQMLAAPFQASKASIR